MASLYSDFTLWQAWVRIAVDGGSAFVLPVDMLRISPVPFVHGSDGSTAKQLWDGSYVYRCEGWRHDVTLDYQELPEEHHETFRDLVWDLHSNGGEALVTILNSDKTMTAREVEVVADFSGETITAMFDGRVRERPAVIQFKGKRPLPFPKSWITD